MMDQYYVLGNPIEHSRSPFIHRYFAQNSNQILSYDAKLVALDGFMQSIEQLKAEGFKGCNITVPFKEQAFEVADKLTQRAELAGAVNTLVYDGQTLLGDNTDGIGLVNDLQHLQVSLDGANLLILGAGGAARGILAPLLGSGVAQVVIANRTVAKAQSLVERMRQVANCPLNAVGYDDLQGHFDVIINATSCSISGVVPPIPTGLMDEHSVAYDLMYGSHDTTFMEVAGKYGATCHDGLGMLVEQAAESFYLWRGVRPDTSQLIDLIRREMRHK